MLGTQIEAVVAAPLRPSRGSIVAVTARRCVCTGMLLPYLVLLPAVLLSAGQKQDKTTSPARNPVEGVKIFRYYCAACHGADGRGHGPASVALKHAVPDLTLISQRNGGKFPRQQVKDIIEGKRIWSARSRKPRDANLGANFSLRRVGRRLGRSKV